MAHLGPLSCQAKFKRDGSMPLLLEGYGSYGISEEPAWLNSHTLYADLGFVVATAHIRGGGDLGEPWYQASKFLSKKRTFLDFIACADKLTAEKYTSVGNVAICGGSAGGMLVGACLNMRPELFKAVIAHVPFVTVLDTMLDGELPLTPGEFKEWGNPRDEHYFEYMQSYCPYENVGFVKDFLARGNSMPSIFATAGLSDYRVGYYECAKWIARIREGVAGAKAEGEIKEPMVIMETNMNAGHAGASGRFDRLKEKSRDVAFLATEFEKSL
jgi:oligopeptidase B